MPLPNIPESHPPTEAAPSSPFSVEDECRELRAKVRKLDKALTSAISDRVLLDEQHIKVQAELIDVRKDRNMALQRASALTEELAGVRSQMQHERSELEVTRRLRQFFGSQPEPWAREQVLARSSQPEERVRKMEHRALVEQLLKCYHKRPRAAPRYSPRPYLVMIAPCLPLVAVVLRAALPWRAAWLAILQMLKEATWGAAKEE